MILCDLGLKKGLGESQVIKQHETMACPEPEKATFKPGNAENSHAQRKVQFRTLEIQRKYHMQNSLRLG